jgi:hypothetical protein
VLAPRPRGGWLVRPGKFFRRRGWRRLLRDLALRETCRTGFAERQRNRPPSSFPEHPTQTSACGRSALRDLALRSSGHLARSELIRKPRPIERHRQDARRPDGWCRIKRRDMLYLFIAGRRRLAGLAGQPRVHQPPPTLVPARQPPTRAGRRHRRGERYDNLRKKDASRSTN